VWRTDVDVQAVIEALPARAPVGLEQATAIEGLVDPNRKQAAPQVGERQTVGGRGQARTHRRGEHLLKRALVERRVMGGQIIRRRDRSAGDAADQPQLVAEPRVRAMELRQHLRRPAGGQNPAAACGDDNQMVVRRATGEAINQRVGLQPLRRFLDDIEGVRRIAEDAERSSSE